MTPGNFFTVFPLLAHPAQCILSTEMCTLSLHASREFSDDLPSSRKEVGEEPLFVYRNKLIQVFVQLLLISLLTVFLCFFYKVGFITELIKPCLQLIYIRFFSVIRNGYRLFYFGRNILQPFLKTHIVLYFLFAFHSASATL